MGLIVKRNRDKKYQLFHSASDEMIHDKEWLTEDEVKKILIEREFSVFMEKAVKVDMEFPNNYSVNGKVKEFNSIKFLEWWQKECNFGYEGLYSKAKGIFKRLKIRCDYEE